MKWRVTAMVLIVALFTSMAACGDDDSGGASPDGGSTEGPADGGDDGVDAPSGGSIDDPAPPGTATASVDGQDLTFDTVLASGCSIAGDAITFGFSNADGTVTIAAGLNPNGDDWDGNIRVELPNPEGEGTLAYNTEPAEGITLPPGSVVVDGSSMTYEGPMLFQPPNDGSNPPPESVGDGTIRATC